MRSPCADSTGARVLNHGRALQEELASPLFVCIIRTIHLQKLETRSNPTLYCTGSVDFIWLRDSPAKLVHKSY